MSNDKPQFTEGQKSNDKQANINVADLQQARGEQPVGITGSDINKLGFPPTRNFDTLLAYADDTKTKDSTRAQIQEKIRGAGKSAEGLQSLADSMPSIDGIELGQAGQDSSNNLSVALRNSQISKIELPKDTIISTVKPRSIEFGKEVKFNFKDGKLTNINGIKVTVDAPKDGELRVGGPIEMESISADLKEATLEKEDGKDYLKARIALDPEDPKVTSPIRIPLTHASDRSTEKASPKREHSSDAKDAKLSLDQITQLAQGNIKNPEDLSRFVRDLKSFQKLAERDEIPKTEIEKTYGQLGRLLSHNGNQYFSKEQARDIATARLHELADSGSKMGKYLRAIGSPSSDLKAAADFILTEPNALPKNFNAADQGRRIFELANVALHDIPKSDHQSMSQKKLTQSQEDVLQRGKEREKATQQVRNLSGAEAMAIAHKSYPGSEAMAAAQELIDEQLASLPNVASRVAVAEFLEKNSGKFGNGMTVSIDRDEVGDVKHISFRASSKDMSTKLKAFMTGHLSNSIPPYYLDVLSPSPR